MISPATLPLLIVLAVLVAALPWPWFIVPLAGVLLIAVDLLTAWRHRE